MNGLKQRGSGPFRIEVGGRGKSDSASDGTAKVRQNVTEEIVGDNYVIAGRVLDKINT